MAMFLTRRQFLKTTAGTIAAVAIADQALALTALQPVIEVGNPLGEYPDRSWERVYHDQYRYDSSFTYICTPNDTHACRVRAFVRNGVVMRVEQNYDHQTYEGTNAAAVSIIGRADISEGRIVTILIVIDALPGPVRILAEGVAHLDDRL